MGGQEVSKDHPRIEAYGTIDELNAILGLVRVFNGQSAAPPASRARVDAMLHRIQNDLFNVGSDLATRPEDRWPGMYRVGEGDVAQLERWCDELNEDVGPLKEFILPGGGVVGAFLHQARTVCRRSERDLVAHLHEEPDTGEGVMRYVNRLSDFLFMLGRWAAKESGEREVFWEKPANG